MSEENLQQLFSDFIETLHVKLAEVDEKYEKNGDLHNIDKCNEQVEIYKSFIDRLVKNGYRCFDIINTLREKLEENSFDASSEPSITDERVYGDLEFLRRCLDNRVGIEERAISSLADLEATVFSLMKENDRLKKLHERSVDVNVAAPNIDQTTSNLILKLEKENDELKEANERNQRQLEKMQGESDDAKQSESESESSEASEPTIDETPKTPPPSSNQSNCEEELADLKETLAMKDKTIRDLVEQISELKKGLDPNSNKSGGKNMRRSQSDIGRTDRPNDSPSLTDSETRDNDTLKTLEKGYKELAQILKEKYGQLRAQRAKIDDMKKKLENCAAQGQELLDLKDEMAKLRQRNKQLEDDIQKLQTSGATLEEIKKQSEIYNAELEKLKEREQILARKITLQEEQVCVLLSERQNLLRINNEMLNSIAICQKELCQYNVE